jgi:hypothetical protein
LGFGIVGSGCQSCAEQVGLVVSPTLGRRHVHHEGAMTYDDCGKT